MDVYWPTGHCSRSSPGKPGEAGKKMDTLRQMRRHGYPGMDMWEILVRKDKSETMVVSDISQLDIKEEREMMV